MITVRQTTTNCVNLGNQLVDLFLVSTLHDLDETDFEFVEDVLADVVQPTHTDTFFQQVQVLPPECVGVVLLVLAT